ncbi:HlyD family efflux transporter periplasmic adaptor subunit [Sphingobacterium corticibacterium]|uniref:HlyD family efflux transporter periplasmic adaptor subunit n=1 Tax=Sphingobacterium corticibacterium TaxID=2484746 RepID=A0A4Q6XTT8_9SPHI|nr:HlyD family efflux transporter periplasmic adaptor subunit [Sphingobacterium corticibacterium]
MAKKNYQEEEVHSEDLQEIIAKPPSWLLQRGISFVLLTILLILGLSVFIRYPEIVPANMKLTTVDAPKIVVSRTAGHLVKLLVEEGTPVTPDMDLAYMESTADHTQVLALLERLKSIRAKDNILLNLEHIAPPQSMDLGELQNDYHNFYLAYLNYRAIDKEGIFNKRKAILLRELANTDDQNRHIQESYELQKRELALAEEEYNKYRILAEKKIVSQMELQQKEALLLSKRQSIPQMENNLITNNSSLLAKSKELSEIDNQILEESKKFLQALNSFISSAENWKKQYVLSSSSTGKLIYGSFLQEGQLVQNGQEMFYVYTKNEDFYGEMYIPQQASSKVGVGQEVLIKVRSYPYQEYGYLHGKISYLSDIPLQDSVFFSKVDLIRTAQDSLIKLKPGIRADAEIITEDQSIFKRIWMNLTKSLKL